jgi:hypothetical protein
MIFVPSSSYIAESVWMCAEVARANEESKRKAIFLFLRPEIRRDYPLNLSILISGGKETNQDSLSNGE